MPRLPIDYSKCVIYKIVCLDKNIDYIYVGSTCRFVERKCAHKGHTTNINAKHYTLKLYETIREHGGWNNWNMVQIEEYPCNNKREAEQREEYWRVELQAQLNSKRCYGAENKKEYEKIYQQDKKEYIKQYQKMWIESNKEHIRECNKLYRDTHKELISSKSKQYYDTHKEHIQQYVKDNKEHIAQRQKQYREDNRDRLREQQKQRYQKRKLLLEQQK